MRHILLPGMLLLLLTSCQKEIDWGLRSNKDGDLLYKALEISVVTNDTNTINFKYDTEKRLIEYHSKGKVNAQLIDMKYVITRDGSGKILKIKETISGFIDSTIFLPTYANGKLQYSISQTYASLFTQKDSSVFSYNSAGLVSGKKMYTDILGTMELTSEQFYTYDGSGNPIKIDYYASDMMGGMILFSSVTQTFTSRKNPVTLGEESFLILEPSNVAVNYISQRVINSVLGQDFTTSITGQTFTNNNRPMQSLISTTPQPPGYDVKVTFFYQ
jgi:hypothetical protein